MTTESDKLFMEELQKDFLDEATFLIEQCEESYLKLEQPENRREELGKIFRLAHSMKGAGASVGFSDLSHFAHGIEDCLSILRVNTDLVTSEIISLLLRAGDALKLRVKMLKKKSNDLWVVSDLSTELKLTAQKLGGKPTVSSENSAAVVAPADVAVLKDKEPSEEIKKATNAAGAPAAQNRAQSNSVKVDTERIDSVLNMVGELVVIKSQLMNETRNNSGNAKLNDLVSHLDKSIRDLQERALGMRMTPLKNLFLKTQRIIRDLSIKLNKPVSFEMSGEETEIDRTMIELLSDPLMHIVRNALDHGIEKAESRKAIGKTANGTIKLVAQQTGSRVIVKISDDGAGISREKIIKKAIEKGLIIDGKNPTLMADEEVYQYIFAPGFSTAEHVSDVSGRGVGMDVVKTNIDQLRGTIEIKSEFGKGTSFIISVPLTTSITDGMQVVSAGHCYILPLDRIRELINSENEITTQLSPDQVMLNVRGKILPVIDLEKMLKRGKEFVDVETSNKTAANTVIVVESNKGLVALRLHAVIGQVQVVLKPLGEYFSSSPAVAGAAIMGDGKVALVLDVDNLEQSDTKAA